MKKIIYILLLAVVTSFTFSSCEDMLTGEMDRHVEADELASDTLYAYWGILRSMQGIAERYVILGECRGDLVDGTSFVQDSIHNILDFNQNATDGSDAYHRITDYYHVINSCNAYIANCNTEAMDGLSQRIMLKEYAQVVSIRAWVYMQLVLTYGRVPYFEKPMLSTAEMEDFRNAPQWVDANSLATSGVVQLLESVRSVQAPYSESSSGSYGVANASTCIFPQNLVLGDIYLLAAGSDKNYYIQAAQRYYDFLNTEKGGPLRPNQYVAGLIKNQSTNQYEAIYLGINNSYASIFSSGRTMASSTAEVVTVIPSATNKLRGRVLRDICELFGFTSTVSVYMVEGSEKESSSVSLRPNFEHQLGYSKAYEALSNSQSFEAYIGDAPNTKCTVSEGAGDARRHFVTASDKDYQSGGTEEIFFVMKQNSNPNFGGTVYSATFSTTYPIIYRKGSIWLRFAAALNGAGFPGYAFAILRHGLCGNPDWTPNSKYDFAPKTYVYWDDAETVVDPVTEEADTTFYTDANKFYFHVYETAVADGKTFDYAPADQAELESILSNIDSDPNVATFDVALKTYLRGNTNFKKRGETFEEWCVGSRTTIDKSLPAQLQTNGENEVYCNYITKSEWQKAANYSFSNFTTKYLQGGENSLNIPSGTTEYSISLSGEKDPQTAEIISAGIHSRGCGTLKLTEDPHVEGVEGGTTYNYVTQINKMLMKYEGESAMSEADIYSDDATKRAKVQRAIADLLLEEMALETCFEGNRFYDLLCYSRFMNGMGQNGTERVARKIASRSGSINGNLYSKLLDQNNWYLPCP